MVREEISHRDAREANQYLAEQAREIGRAAPLGFLCECSDPGCIEPVPLEVTQYEVLRHVWAPVVAHRPAPAIRRS